LKKDDSTYLIILQKGFWFLFY